MADCVRSIMDTLFLQDDEPIAWNIGAHVNLSGQLFAVFIEPL